MKRLLAPCVLVLAACSSRTVFRFQPSPPATGAPVLPDGVAVLELADARGRRAIDHNLKFLALIPCVPFAVSHRDFPERTYFDTSRNLNGFVPTVALAKAFADEIETQRVFERCRYVGTSPHGERYELRGRIDDCHVTEGYLTYGLSLASVLLHVVGFPEGTLRCVLRLHVEIVDRRDRSVVWSADLEDSSTRATWIYSSEEADLACAAFTRIGGYIVRHGVAELRNAAMERAASRRASEPASSEPAESPPK